MKTYRGHGLIPVSVEQCGEFTPRDVVGGVVYPHVFYFLHIYAWNEE